MLPNECHGDPVVELVAGRGRLMGVVEKLLSCLVYRSHLA